MSATNCYEREARPGLVTRPRRTSWSRGAGGQPHAAVLIGRLTYEAIEELPVEVRDDGWQRTTITPG